MYVRCDKDCNPASPQPGSVLVTDVYGNSFRNWCVDYIGTDKDCAPDGTTGCAPQITVVWTRISVTIVMVQFLLITHLH